MTKKISVDDSMMEAIAELNNENNNAKLKALDL